MNYRHAFHAGNFADVVKHAVLARVLVHLRQKPAAFRVVDTHAGAGVYDLAGPEALRSGEWREGIGRLRAAGLAPAIRELLAPYLDAVAALNPQGRLARYPGSPALARHWLRPQDRLIACELEPSAAAALARSLRGDARSKAIAIDGWQALAAYLPPKERRGVVLVDPPFEQEGEYARLAENLGKAHRRWPTGIYLAWYPVKDAKETATFARRVARLGIAKVLRAEVTVAAQAAMTRLRGTGLLLVNPPWTLPDELAALLPALAATLAHDGKGETRLDWLAGA
jgi:23S rRNA (adenine2030-N6)-methyltransferase